MATLCLTLVHVCPTLVHVCLALTDVVIDNGLSGTELDALRTRLIA